MVYRWRHRTLPCWLGVAGSGALLIQLSLTACSLVGPDAICSDGQIDVERSVHGLGSYCAPHKPTDKDCPPDQITRLILSTGHEDCITNEVGHERDGLPGQ